MHKEKILIIEDDLATVKYVRATLEANGYKAFAALDGVEGIRVVEQELPDLILLDIMMPKMDGYGVLNQLREWSRIPIIMVSAKGDESDKVECLDLGADDYLSKPFGIQELLARVRAVLRRTELKTNAPTPPCFICDDLEVNFVDRRVTVAGREVKLTPTEYNLLRELVLNTNKVITHSMLLGRVWGSEYRDEREYLHVFIRRLRSKLEPDKTNPLHIVSVPGIGYQFKTV